MLATALLCGELARRVRMPAVIGELLGGILLGPTWLNLFPVAAPGREVVARIGLICFLFVAGLEVNIDHIRRQGLAVAGTSVGGILVPFALAAGAVFAMPSVWRQPLTTRDTALFLGAALAISALPVIARIIHDLGFERLPLSSVILASATIDDVLGWSLFAAIAGSKAPLTTLTVVPFLLGALFSRKLGRMERLRWVVIRLVAPLFFVSLGLKVNFIANFDWRLVALVIVIASIGKIAGAMLGARLGGFAPREAAAIAIAMNARGAVEIVLASVALQVKLIDARLFVALVVMAVVTSVIAGPSMQAMLGEKSARSLQQGSSSLQSSGSADDPAA